MPPDIDERQRRDAKMDAVKIYPAKLKGHIKVPSSKSLSHRAIICAGLSNGESVIENLVLSEDIKATLEGMEAFGAQVKYKRPVSHVPGEPEEHCTISIKGNFDAVAQNRVIKGGPDVGAKDRIIDCRESGSTLRFLIPLACIAGGKAAPSGEGVVFTGRGKLIHRPLYEYYEIFERQGIEYHTDGGGLPLTVKGALKPGVFRVRGDASSQFISGLMFALPLLDGDSAIEVTTGLESRGYVELTLDVLESFGIGVENDSFRRFQILGNQRYQNTNYRVEGDYSQAAFWLAAG